jgi:glycosyltransferase involved in cell wall biosynthesis
MSYQMQIIYLHQYFNTPEMSGGTRSYEMARRMVLAGHEVNLITSQREPINNDGRWFQTQIEGINVHWLPISYSNRMTYKERTQAFFRFAWRAAQKAASLPADIVFATSTPLTIALPAVYAAKKMKVPMVFEVRDLWPELPIKLGALKNPFAIAAARWLEKFAYQNAAQIVALSPGMRDGIVKTGYPTKRVHVIPNSADLKLFNVPPDIGVVFRQKYDWLRDRPLVVYAGTIGYSNGVYYLVKLASVVKEKDNDIRFIVVGEGKEELTVRRLAEKMGVLNNNFFMIGSMQKTEMPTILSAATIATSLVIDVKELWHNSANKFFDTLASGTPVAINYEGWQADILRETGAGIVLDAKDINHASEILLNSIRNKTWLENAGRAALKLAKECFDRDQLAENMLEVFKLALEIK